MSAGMIYIPGSFLGSLHNTMCYRQPLRQALESFWRHSQWVSGVDWRDAGTGEMACSSSSPLHILSKDFCLMDNRHN